ncbi:hypothetical protein BASA62_009928 [Batrachochytrium salamandrivorans]|nr:hypothetical protein BASA62_009928 [Batrachochytrium salamandrivorans]
MASQLRLLSWSIQTLQLPFPRYVRYASSTPYKGMSLGSRSVPSKSTPAHGASKRTGTRLANSHSLKQPREKSVNDQISQRFRGKSVNDQASQRPRERSVNSQVSQRPRERSVNSQVSQRPRERSVNSQASQRPRERSVNGQASQRPREKSPYADSSSHDHNLKSSKSGNTNRKTSRSSGSSRVSTYAAVAAKKSYEQLADIKLPLTMPWKKDDMDPLDALDKFPVSMRYSTHKDNSAQENYQAAIDELSSKPQTSISLNKYLFLLSSPHNRILPEDLLWKAYTGFIVSASERFTILPVHLDHALTHLLKQVIVTPDIADILNLSLAPIPPLSDSIKSKILLILDDYSEMGFAPTPAVWSARIIIAVCEGDYALSQDYYRQAHLRLSENSQSDVPHELETHTHHPQTTNSLDPEPSEPISFAPLLTEPSPRDSAILGNSPKESESDNVTQKEILAEEFTNVELEPHISIVDYNLSVKNSIGLTIEGYNAMISVQARIIYQSKMSILPVSVYLEPESPERSFTQHSTMGVSLEASSSFTKGKVWEILSDMRQANVVPGRITFEMWLYIFGRLHQAFAVRKIQLRLYSYQVPMRNETLLILLDALTETKASEKAMNAALGKYSDRFKQSLGSPLQTAWIKYWIIQDRPGASWKILDKLIAKKSKLNYPTAAMLIQAGYDHHSGAPKITRNLLGGVLKSQLLSGNTELHPDIWCTLIRSYGDYSGDDSYPLVVSSYNVLITILFPAWKNRGFYGIGKDSRFICDMPTQECVAYALGRTFNTTLSPEFFGPNGPSGGLVESLVEKFMSGWLDADGSVEDLKPHIAEIMNPQQPTILAEIPFVTAEAVVDVGDVAPADTAFYKKS